GADLVVQAPEADRRVIEILLDQLAQLLPGVVLKRLGRADAIHQRQLRPDDDAGAVAQAVLVFGMLIVRHAHNGASNLSNEAVILVNLPWPRRPAFVEIIL